MACRGSGVRVPVAPPDRDTVDPHPSPTAGGEPSLGGREHGVRDDTHPPEAAVGPSRRKPKQGRALRPIRHRAALAGAVGGARPVRDRPGGHVQAEVLPADDVSVSVRRPAHRPLVHRHAERRAGPLPADARLQRVLPDRIRCVRAARRERGDQERRPPVQLDDEEHREHAPPVPDDGRHVRLGARGRHRRPLLLPLEPVAVPALPGGGPGLSADFGGRLVPQRRHARARAGRGRGPALLALRRAGREARPGPVVPQDDRVCR